MGAGMDGEIIERATQRSLEFGFSFSESRFTDPSHRTPRSLAEAYFLLNGSGNACGEEGIFPFQNIQVVGIDAIFLF